MPCSYQRAFYPQAAAMTAPCHMLLLTTITFQPYLVISPPLSTLLTYPNPASPTNLTLLLAQVHGQCETVMTRFRPVPLTWHYCHTLEGKTQLVPLLNSKGTNMSAQMLGESDQPQQDEDSGWLGANRAERRRRKCATFYPVCCRTLPACYIK